jgi:hypothetical protein
MARSLPPAAGHRAVRTGPGGLARAMPDVRASPTADHSLPTCLATRSLTGWSPLETPALATSGRAQRRGALLGTGRSPLERASGLRRHGRAECQTPTAQPAPVTTIAWRPGPRRPVQRGPCERCVSRRGRDPGPVWSGSADVRSGRGGGDRADRCLRGLSLVEREYRAWHDGVVSSTTPGALRDGLGPLGPTSRTSR